MITELIITDQYGKKSVIGVSICCDDDGENKVYAHSVQDAIEWITKYPLFENATIDKFDDGLVYVHSEWIPFSDPFTAIYDVDPHKGAEFTRQRVVIRPVNTIFESVGFQGLTK